jgi:prevent-host-death family protein
MRTVLFQVEPPEARSLMARKSRSAPPIERIAISKARSMIGQLVNRVHVDKDRFVLEKSGIPVAALIDIEEYKRFLAFQEVNASQ